MPVGDANDTTEHPVVQRFDAVLGNIASARAGADHLRAPQTHLVAVTKTHDADTIRPILDVGHRVFGENRVQEAMGKWPGLREAYNSIELHLIGPLQSNKAAEAVATFDVIETVDRPKIAKALAAEMAKQDRHLPVYVQVNTGLEPQKAGIAPADTATFVDQCRQEHGLNVKGLMCIPPFHENPGPHFALLRKLADETGLPVRSMGMSGDYETAIQFGATHVRVGSAIFGSRAE
ncbi:MAG: YggS family pyridoxal phosphate-dependent enzyme [Pseudomonadota bacterium]